VKRLSKYAVVFALISAFSLASRAEAVDFDASTSLSIHVSSHHIHKGHKVKITGRLTSDHHSCVNDERINLFANGTQVAHTRTAEDGSYKFVRRPHKTTRFRTKYPGKTTGVHPNQHTCEPSVSVVIRVRVT
jgi:hypothetical protein